MFDKNLPIKYNHIVTELIFCYILGKMIELSPKIKALIIGASFLLIAIIIAVIVLVVGQNGSSVKIQSISFEVANQNCAVGERKELTINIYPSNASNKTIIFTSSNTDVVEIVSSNENKVVYLAKSIGAASIEAKCKTNKKLTDSCNIQVSDNIAQSISVASEASGVVGQKFILPISLSPANANYQKLQIISYDHTKLSNPVVSIKNDGAEIVADVLSEGESQLVVGFLAEKNNENVVVLTKQIQVYCEPDLVSELNYYVNSNTLSNANATSNNILIYGAEEYTFNFSYTTNSGVFGKPDNVNITFDSNIFNVTSKGNGKYSVNLRGVPFDSKTIVFEYEGISRSVLFVYGNLADSLNDFSSCGVFNNEYLVDDSYQFNSFSNYLFELPSSVNKLIKYGFAKLELTSNALDNLSDYVELDITGHVLRCKKATNTLNLGVVLKVEYWNKSDWVSSSQKNIHITITEKGFN